MDKAFYDGGVYSEPSSTIAERAVYLDNLDALLDSAAVVYDARGMEVEEIAGLIGCRIQMLTEDGLSTLDALLYMKESGEIPFIGFDNRYSENGYTDAFNFQTRFFDRASFCLSLSSQEGGASISEVDFLNSQTTEETVTYSRNRYSDEAYDVFSQEFTDPRVGYSADFKEAVSRVVDGSFGYCILPLEERGDRLSSMSELVVSRDLRINAVTPVFGFDGSADMKYALVSKQFTLPMRQEGDDRYLELRLDVARGDLSELLFAVQTFGMTVYRISSRPSYGIEGLEANLSLVIRDEGRDFAPLFLYLHLYRDDVSFVGSYKNLE
jgi:hypothetical protein